MARPKKPPASKPSQAYIISFGDTMTTLLAFFIVLCSLAEDQSGANLHSGTGSFSRALETFGMPGQFSRELSEDAISREHANTAYLAAGDDAEPNLDPKGPDANDNDLPVIDREAEQFQRFVNEMERQSERTQLPKTNGQITFDFFNRLNREPPYLTEEYDNLKAQLISLLARDDYQLDLIVWATTPGASAWARAAEQASAVVAELLESTNTRLRDSQQLQALARPWPYSDVKRPVLSIVVRKVDRN